MLSSLDIIDIEEAEDPILSKSTLKSIDGSSIIFTATQLLYPSSVIQATPRIVHNKSVDNSLIDVLIIAYGLSSIKPNTQLRSPLRS